jgi:hypothetical protein
MLRFEGWLLGYLHKAFMDVGVYLHVYLVTTPAGDSAIPHTKHSFCGQGLFFDRGDAWQLICQPQPIMGQSELSSLCGHPCPPRVMGLIGVNLARSAPTLSYIILCARTNSLLLHLSALSV